MSLFDLIELTVECSSCGKKLTQRAATLRKERTVMCPNCGPIGVRGDELEYLKATLTEAECVGPDLATANSKGDANV